MEPNLNQKSCQEHIPLTHPFRFPLFRLYRGSPYGSVLKYVWHLTPMPQGSCLLFQPPDQLRGLPRLWRGALLPGTARTFSELKVNIILG